MRRSSLKPFLALTASALILAACGDNLQAETQTHNDAVDTAQSDMDAAIPHAMLPDTVTPTAYRVDMRINPDEDGYDGVSEIDVTFNAAVDGFWMHGKEMTVSNAYVRLEDGTDVPLTYQVVPAADAPSGVARVELDSEVPAGPATLHLPFETPYNMSLNSAYKVPRGEDAYVVTQFEPLGAREAFPSFDEPRFKVPFTISISAPSDDVVIANTPEESSEELDDGWIKHNFATTRPLPTYLIAYAVGPYDVNTHADLPKTDVRDRTIPLRGVTAKGNHDDITYGLDNTAGILEAIEGYFGIPYPYEKLDLIAAPDYAFGAMENPGAIVYREYLMLMDESAPLSQKRAYARVHSHELAHQWFGNLVTPYWWEDIWLNEAFATWMGNKGTSLWRPDDKYDLQTLKSALGAMNTDSLATTRRIREPLPRSENVMDQFDSITYRKGGGVLSMFESYLGVEDFQKGVRLHMDRFYDDVATADDFFQSLADGSGNPDVVPAMKSFVDQPGLPLVTGDSVCAEDRTSLTISQSRYAPLGSTIEQGQSWQIPVCAEFGFDDGTSEKVCTLMTEKTAMLRPEKDGCADYVMPNENGAGYYRFTLESEDMADLIDNMDDLNVREVLALQDSLDAAYRAGDVDSAVYLDGLEGFANHPEYDVASASGDLLGFMYDDLPAAARPGLAALVQDMYRDRFDRIRGEDTMEGNLLAPTLLSRLVYYGDDTELRAEFAEKGAAYLGLDGAADKEAVEPNKLTTALSLAMIEYPDKAYDPLIALVKDGSVLEKGSALSALGKTTDPEIAAELLDIALNDPDTMTGQNALSLLYSLMHSEEHGEMAWAWIKDNFEAFVPRVPDVRRPSFPGYVPACSAARAEDVKTFFTENGGLIPGYERSLSQAMESAELCIALKDAKAEELTAALDARM